MGGCNIDNYDPEDIEYALCILYDNDKVVFCSFVLSVFALYMSWMWPRFTLPLGIAGMVLFLISWCSPFLRVPIYVIVASIAIPSLPTFIEPSGPLRVVA